MIKIGSILVKYNEGDDYALMDQKDVKGGYHVVNTLQDRQSLHQSLKTEGMLVYVKSNKSTYRLSNNIWKETETAKIGDYEVFSDKATLLASTKGFKKATFIRLTSDNSTYIVNKNVAAPTKLTNADLDPVTATAANQVNYTHSGSITKGRTVQDAIENIADELDKKDLIYIDEILKPNSKTYDAADVANKNKVFVAYSSSNQSANSVNKLVNVHPLVNTIIDEQAILVYVKKNQWYIKYYETDLKNRLILSKEDESVNLYLGLNKYAKLNTDQAKEISIKPIRNLTAANAQEALEALNGKVLFETIDASVSKNIIFANYPNVASYVVKDGSAVSFDGVAQTLKVGDVIIKSKTALKVIRSSSVPDLPADAATANYFLGESGGSLAWKEISNDGFLTQRAVFISSAAIGDQAGQVPTDRILNKVVVSEATTDITLSLYDQWFNNGDKFAVLNPTSSKLTVESAALGKMQGANVIDGQLVLREAESALIFYEDGKFFVISHKNPVHLHDGTWIDPLWGMGDKRPYIEFTTTLADGGKDKAATLNGSLDNVWKPDQLTNAAGKELKFKLKNNKREKFLGIGIVFDRGVNGFGVGTKLKVYGSNDGGKTKVVLTDTFVAPPDSLLKKLAFYGHFLDIDFVQNTDYYNEYTIEIVSGSIVATPFWQEFAFKAPYHGIVTDIKSVKNIDDSSYAKDKTWSSKKIWDENDKIQDHRLIADSLRASSIQAHFDMFYRSGVILENNQDVFVKQVKSKDFGGKYLDSTGTGVNTKIANRPGFYALEFDGNKDYGRLRNHDGTSCKLNEIMPTNEFSIIAVVRPKRFAGGVDLVQVADFESFVHSDDRLNFGLYQSGIACAVGGKGGGENPNFILTRVELDASELQKDMIVIINLDSNDVLSMDLRADGKISKSHSMNIDGIFAPNSSDLIFGRGVNGENTKFDLMEFVFMNGGSSVWHDREHYFEYFSRKWGVDI